MEGQSEVRCEECLPDRYTFSPLHFVISDSGFRNGISNVERVACESHTNAVETFFPSGRCVFEVRERVLARVSAWILPYIHTSRREVVVASGAEGGPSGGSLP